MSATPDLPYFLSSFDSFKEHLEGHLGGRGNTDKGTAFLEMCLRLLPLLDSWASLGPPSAVEKKSHDGGVDFTSKALQGTGVLLGQSKYRMSSRDELDNVISKFADYANRLLQSRTPSLPFKELATQAPHVQFLLVTATKLDGITSSYERSALPSRAFYDELTASDRLKIIDGPALFHQMQALYRRSFIIPTTVELRLSAPYIAADDVFLSVIEGRELRELHRLHGASLFFENIRDFLGFGTDTAAGREGVNDEIRDTLQNAPGKMLSRNNGITFKATGVEVVNDQLLRLQGCGIVNGCQTTMCIVNAGDTADSAKVAIKIVSSADDSWDIAKAANFQNSVRRIDLDLARYLRPQLVAKMATSAGYALDGRTTSPASVTEALDSIHQRHVSYEEMRLLYLGFFSRFPNNLFASNYTELREDVLAAIYDQGHGDRVMTNLFRLLSALPQAMEETKATFASPHYVDLFQRFFRDSNSKYRCFIGLLSACVCLDDWLGDKSPETVKETGRMLGFMDKLDVLLTHEQPRFRRVFLHSFATLADKVIEAAPETGNDSDILQRMYREISGSNFQNLFRRVHMRAQLDPLVRPRGSAET